MTHGGMHTAAHSVNRDPPLQSEVVLASGRQCVDTGSRSTDDHRTAALVDDVGPGLTSDAGASGDGDPCGLKYISEVLP